MNILNLRDQKVELTENEVKVIKGIELEIKEGREMVYGCDVEYFTGLPNKIARGVLSSLVKKECIDINTKDGGLISRYYTIIQD